MAPLLRQAKWQMVSLTRLAVDTLHVLPNLLIAHVHGAVASSSQPAERPRR